jgi:hypothetical protein
LRVSADDWCEVRLNGNVLGTCEDWRSGKQFDGLGAWLKPGTNVLAIVAENKPTALPANPAGLLACLELRWAGGESRRFVSDNSWRCANAEARSWDSAGFDDRVWTGAREIAHYGDGPWGRLNERTGTAAEPQATGIPGSVRIIYVPEREMVEARGLAPQKTYSASCFDPVSGEKRALGKARADARGAWNCAPPLAQDQDWVLVLQDE